MIISKNQLFMEFLEQVKDITSEAAKEAGNLLINGLDRVRIVEFKDRQDICTNLDLEVEKLLVDKIKGKYPNHNILSEELVQENKDSEFTWIIDPIDGTKHYVRGLPLFCISIALQKGNEIIFGLAFNPATNNLFYALKDKGAFLNGDRIYVSEKQNLADSFVYAELPNYKLSKQDFKIQNKRLEKLFQKSYRIRAWGSGALGLCYVAMGGFEAYIVLGPPPKLYDVAAGILIVKEAGGRITNLDGELFSDKNINIIASNGKIHEQILSLLKKD